MLGSTLLSLSVKKVQFLIRARERLNWIEQKLHLFHGPQRFRIEAISELIEIFCFLGLKLTREFFKGFRNIRAGEGSKKFKI